MRMTDYIGLNNAALNFVKDFKRVGSGFFLIGIFGEEIPLGKFIDTKTGQIYLEVSDVEWWSSGPIILTCLIKQGYKEKMFAWIEDKETKNEFIDNKRGIYCIG